MSTPTSNASNAPAVSSAEESDVIPENMDWLPLEEPSFAANGTGQAVAERGTWLSRAVWLFLWLTPLVVIATAATLVPSSVGHGTHTQLGLPPCGFYVTTGMPCPGCGLTTSFAHMVRFQWAGAATANPFGIALFLSSLFTIPVAFLGMVRAWPVVATLERFQFEKVVVLLAICSSLVWCIRIGTMLLS